MFKKYLRGFTVLAGLALLVACVPSVTSFEHIVINPKDGVVVTESVEIEGKELLFGGGVVPVRYVLEREDYIVEMHVPPIGRNLYIKIRVSGKNNADKLMLVSDSVEFNQNLHDFPYTFFLDKHIGGDRIDIDVVASDSTVIGSEIIHFKVIRVGFLYSVDAI